MWRAAMQRAWVRIPNLTAVVEVAVCGRVDASSTGLGMYASYVPNLTAVVEVALCGHVDTSSTGLGMYASYVPNLTAVAVWPCGRILHQWLSVATLHSMLYAGADSAGPPHMQALGEWPLRHYQTFIGGSS